VAIDTPGPHSDGQGDPGRGRLARILSGLSWNTGGQVATAALNLLVTPFLLIHLGVSQYGLYALLSSLRGLLSNIDGGLGPTASRYFAVFAGSRDRRATSSLLMTISALLALVVGTIAALVAIFAPDITVFVHASTALHREAAVLLRAFMPLMFAAALRAVFQQIISAQHRWAYLNVSRTVSTVVYVVLALVFVGQGHGLIGLFWANVGQELVLVLASVVGSRGFVNLRECRLLPWGEIRDIVRYASRVQVAAVSSSFNFEIDSLLVGLIFPVRYVAFYSIGANFSSQLGSLPVNAVSPIAVTLSRTYGRSDLQTTLLEFVDIQRVWVRAIAAYPLIGAVSVYFAILRWLGPQERLAGIVASILLVGQTITLLSQVMAEFGKSIKRPGLESRYLGVGMLVNVAFTVPLAFTIGMLGVPIGTALGQVASNFYFLHIARREIDAKLRSFFADVPKLAVTVGVLTTACLEVPAFKAAPHGLAGLVLCAIPAVIGLGIYALMVTGFKHTFARAAGWAGHGGGAVAPPEELE
jgi:O-antigen/teichoic acid export membrane protein